MGSYFKGGLASYVILQITNIILIVFTLGLAAPWAITRTYRWEIENTIIDGRRLIFNGSAIGLFSHWIKWWFLTLITFGIYGFWVHIKVIDWKARHTHLA